MDKAKEIAGQVLFAVFIATCISIALTTAFSAAFNFAGIASWFYVPITSLRMIDVIGLIIFYVSVKKLWSML